MLSGFVLKESISKVANKDVEPSPISFSCRLGKFVSLVTDFILLVACFYSLIWSNELAMSSIFHTLFSGDSIVDLERVNTGRVNIFQDFN